MQSFSILFAVLLGVSAALAFRRVPNPIGKVAQPLSLNSRVVGGQEAERNFAPYQVSIQGQWDSHMCGGSIIEKRWVLTAAHCVSGFNASYLLILTGVNKLTEKGRFYQVEEYYVHCMHNYNGLAHDIALVRLAEDIQMNSATQPIQLPTAPLVNGDQVVLTGWGSTTFGSPLVEALQKITLTYLDYNSCNIALGNDPNLDEGHICTFTKEGEGSCHGDSGGPLAKNNTVYGVVNWGYPCATGVPDAYASVYYNLDWIHRTMSGCKACHCSASNYPSK